MVARGSTPQFVLRLHLTIPRTTANATLAFASLPFTTAWDPSGISFYCGVNQLALLAFFQTFLLSGFMQLAA
jgi:hypothetical protein